MSKSSPAIFVFAVSILSVMSVRADVGIGNDIITTGTEIKVLEPSPDLDLQAIIDEIDDAGFPGPKLYLIRLGPGSYTITPNSVTGFGLVMKPFVSIVGSAQSMTLLTGAISSSIENSAAAIVTSADSTLLSNLSVRNTAGTDSAIAIYNRNVRGLQIERVTAYANGGTASYGVYNSVSSPTMTDVTVTAVGGTDNRGVYNLFSSPTMTDVSVTAEGGSDNTGVYNDNGGGVMRGVVATAASGTNSNTGVFNKDGSSPSMTDVRISAFGGNTNYGIHNDRAGPTMTDVSVTASGGNESISVFNNSSSSPTMTEVRAIGTHYGVFNGSGSHPVIWRSYLKGGTNAIRFGGSTLTRISYSQLVGGIDADPLGVQCRDTYDENLADVTC